MANAGRSHLYRSYGVLLTLAVLNCATALVGAIGLTTGFLDLGQASEDRLPWDSPVLGGLALGALVAVPNAVLAWLAIRRDPRTGPMGMAVGLGMVVWILVELAFIRELSFFHPLYLVVGLVMLRAGRDG